MSLHILFFVVGEKGNGLHVLHGQTDDFLFIVSK